MSTNSETYIVSAKTVDEAMAIAQREYGGAGKDISFDILEMPKKGFLGFGARDAKIKVTVTEEEEINLGSIVAEMKSQRLREERSSRSENRTDNRADKEPKQKSAKPAQDKPVAKEAPKQDRPVAKETPKQDKPVAKETPKQDKPVVKEPPKQDKPVTKETPKQEKPVTKETPKQDKPVVKETPKQEKPVTKEPPKQDRPVAKETPKQDKPVAKETPKQDKPVEKPQHKESQASGILDNMPAYKVKDEGSNTPVYKETGANVKTYEKRPISTGAVADGSLPGESAPVTDVRWDSARDLKKAAEATAAAMAAVSAKAAPITEPAVAVTEPATPVSEPAAKHEAYHDTLTEKAETPEVLREVEKETEMEEEEVYVPSDGSIDVDALNAAIDAMVEDLPAPENRKKVGVTQTEMEHALAFVNTLLANMQIQATAYALPCPEGEEYETSEGADVYPAVEIAGEGAGILIGHHGETMDAIQYLLNLAAIRHSDNPAVDYVKISLDIENYRAKREETLRSLARRMANRALKYKRNVFLEPMNAYERRIIHSELQSVENVSTHSVGTDKNRKIVITYEGPDKVMDKGRGRGFDEERPENGRRNDRRDRKRRENSKNEAKAETVVADVAASENEGEATENSEKPQQSRSRNRNRNRNRRGRKPAMGTDAQTENGGEESQLTPGAAAILSAEEREEIDRQLSDPNNGTDRNRNTPKPVAPEEIPEFLRQPVIEQTEHLREN